MALPPAQAVTLMHPADGRPVLAYPWEGVTLVGTTGVDHGDGLAREPAITRAEFDCLMAALRLRFPQLSLTDGDVVAIPPYPAALPDAYSIEVQVFRG